jgi:hypothetical protein
MFNISIVDKAIDLGYDIVYCILFVDICGISIIATVLDHILDSCLSAI